MQENKTNYLVLIALIIYILSPLDLFPGPVDDIALSILYYFYNKKIK